MPDRKPGFADFKEALEIFERYVDDYAGFHCEHDTLYVCGVTKDSVSAEDLARLDRLGFFWSDSEDSFISYRWGAC